MFAVHFTSSPHPSKKTFKVKEASSVVGTKLRGIGAKVVFTDTTILCVVQRPT